MLRTRASTASGTAVATPRRRAKGERILADLPDGLAELHVIEGSGH